MNSHPTPPSKKPPRAEPRQPDRPGRGDDVQSDASDDPASPAHRDEESAARQKRQSDDALENVREGYG